MSPIDMPVPAPEKTHRGGHGDRPRVSIKCAERRSAPRAFAPGTSSARVRAIVQNEKKWANGTFLRYHFFDRDTDGAYVKDRRGPRRFVPWKGDAAQMDAVREAFDRWAGLGVGLRFVETDDREDAEIRIGFMPGDGHWSYVGRDVLGIGRNHRTMNLDGPLDDEYGRDTALHEIGHTLGMPHEHQSPFAGIEWNEAEVYRLMALPPNNWDRRTTYDNIISKLSPHEVTGTAWDPDSIMHYEFEPGMIDLPERYRTGLVPSPGLSERDKAWALESYPPMSPLDALPKLRRFASRSLTLAAGEQFDAVFDPEETGEHTIQTFGETDMLVTVFEMVGDRPQFIAGEDDSGEPRNATLTCRMLKGRRYVVRARLFYSRSGGDCAIMIH